jgi:hypothetical protein
VVNDVVERVRRAIYDTFARQGRVASRDEIRNLAGVGDTQLTEAVADLAAHHHLVLDDGTALPFPI